MATNQETLLKLCLIMNFKTRLLLDSPSRYSFTMDKIYLFIILICSAFILNAQGNKMNLTGDASQVNDQFFNIDLVNGSNQIGGAWYPQSFNLDSNFYVDVFVDFGNLKAEGMAIVLHTDSIPVGTGGAQLGTSNNGPSFVTEFDLVQNISTNDAIVPHASFFKNGGTNHQNGDELLQDGTLTPALNSSESLRISWDADNQKFTILRQGCTNTFLNYTSDLKNVLFNGKSKVYLGFTASTSSTPDRINILYNYNSNGITANSIICQGEEIKLHAYNATPTIWSSDEPFLTTSNSYEIIAQPEKSAYYKVSTLDFCGFNEDSIFVEVNDTVSYTTKILVDDDEGPQEIIVEIEDKNKLSKIEWLLPDSSRSLETNLSTTVAGTYFLSVTSTNGCSTNQSIEIPPFEKDEDNKPDNNEISTEDFFTPNGDGEGDLILIQVQGESKIIDFEGKILKTVHEGDLWNGTNESGKTLPSGVYIIVGKDDRQVITILR